MATRKKTDEDDGLVGPISSEGSTRKRQRFSVELKPGETTIVSWRKLLREGNPIDPCPSETPKRVLDDNSDVGDSSNSMVMSERFDLRNRSLSSGFQQLRKRGVVMKKIEEEKHDDILCTKHARLEDISPRDSAQAVASLAKPLSHSSIPPMVKDNHFYEKKNAPFGSRSTCLSPVKTVGDVSKLPSKTKQSSLKKTEKLSSGKRKMKVGISGDRSDIIRQDSADHCAPFQNDPRLKKFMDQKKFDSQNQHSEKIDGCRELVDVVSPSYDYASQHSKSAYIAANVTKPFRPFNTVLERAVRELEETVAESNTLIFEASASWLTIERELPVQVQLKLSAIAKIVQSSGEIMLEKLVHCLVSIIGKLVHGKTMKRPLRRLVMLKLSAKKEKAEKFKAIKNEILSMVSNEEIRASNFPEAKEEAILAETYELDSAMEDRLCDLYDLCVQGLAGDKGVEVQKLFTELGDLWPKGAMDHRKLTDAISRAKKRRRALADKDKDQKAINSLVSPVSCRKRKVTYSNDSQSLTSSPPFRKSAKTPYPLLKNANHTFPTERKLSSSQKQRVTEKKRVGQKPQLLP